MLFNDCLLQKMEYYKYKILYVVIRSIYKQLVKKLICQIPTLKTAKPPNYV